LININDPKTGSLYDVLPVVFEKQNGDKFIDYASSVKTNHKKPVTKYDDQNEFGNAILDKSFKIN
jgi:hypothetical protein